VPVQPHLVQAGSMIRSYRKRRHRSDCVAGQAVTTGEWCVGSSCNAVPLTFIDAPGATWPGYQSQFAATV
jgi:hypothetical protein